MTKDNNTIIWIIIGVAIALLIGTQTEMFSTSGNSMERNVPSTVAPGESFVVSYTVSGSGTWGASIIDSASGGCKFPDGSNELKAVMLSTEGNLKTIQVIAPSSGSCTFSGDYKFGTEAIKNFASDTITISVGGDGGLVCATDVKQCSDGSYVSRNPNNNCEFYPCPANGGEVQTFDLNQVLFKLGSFEVTILVLLIVVAGIVLISLLKK